MRETQPNWPVAVPRLPSGIPNVPIWRMTVENDHQLFDAGIVTEGKPLELLQGWLVPKMKKSPRHGYVASQLELVLKARWSQDWWIDRQHPITMADSEPEPDMAVVRGDVRACRDHHPTPRDIAVVREVAHSTLPIDRGLKLQVYASAGIPEYRIANIPEECLEVYTDPVGKPALVGVPHEIETREGYPLQQSDSRYRRRADLWARRVSAIDDSRRRDWTGVRCGVV